MPRIPLWVEPEPDAFLVRALDPDGRPLEVCNRRVYCRLLVGRDLARHSAIVDTGAPTTVFPFRVWQRFQADIRWLAFADGSGMKPATLGGVAYRYRLGRVSVRLAGRDNEPVLPAVDVVAQFEQPDFSKPPHECVTRTLVGLLYGPLEGRCLVVGPRHALPERAEAWVTGTAAL